MKPHVVNAHHIADFQALQQYHSGTHTRVLGLMPKGWGRLKCQSSRDYFPVFESHSRVFTFLLSIESRQVPQIGCLGIEGAEDSLGVEFIKFDILLIKS